MESKKPEGLGGWLILVLLSLIIGGLLWLQNTFVFLRAVFSGGMENPFIQFILSLLITASIAYSLYLAFNKKKSFVKWALISMWGAIAVIIIISILDTRLSMTVGSFSATLIWTMYLLVSKRVENTFVK